MGSNFYNDLGIPIDATPEDIRKAFFLAAKRLHPDANPSDKASEQFLRIQNAYQVLSDSDKRTRYNASLPDSLKVVPKIGIDIQSSLLHIPKIDSKQLCYVLLDIQSHENASSAPRSAVHLCLVIDQSTSMRGDRLNQVKTNVSHLIQDLSPNDLVSVISFSDRADVLLAPTKASNRSAIEGSLRQISASGATEIFQGLQAAYQVMSWTKEQAPLRQILLLTDGHTYGDEDRSLELARQAALEGISISAFGIGDEWNDKFLDNLTGISGERATFISSDEDLGRYLHQKLEGLNQLYAKGVTFNFEPDPRAALQFSFRLQPSEGPLVGDNPIPLGDIHYGKSLKVLFEFEIQPTIQEVEPIHLLHGQVGMEIPSQAVPYFRKTVQFSRSISPERSSGGIPSVIVHAMSRLTLYRMQEKARAEAAAGDIESATRHLRHLATHLFAKGENQLAQTVLKEAESLAESNHLSPEGEKRIKYGTRALLMLPEPEYRSR